MTDQPTDQPGWNDRTRTEYGVIVDRRSAGLGFHLAHVSRSRENAEAFAARVTVYPAQVNIRRVYVGSWQPLPAAEEASQR